MQAEEEVILIRGKRSKRPRPGSPSPLTMATTSSTTAEFIGGGGSGGGVISDVSGNSNRANLNPSPSNSGHELNQGRDEEEDMAHCLILLAKGQIQKQPQAVAVAANQAAGAAKGEVYQCKTCNKSFPSFQALGGHRASHKKPLLKLKAVALEAQKKPLRESTINLSLQITSRTRRVHECSICGTEFASGQALGGHMRRHRPMPTSSHGEYPEDKRPRTLLPLDLNLPAPAPESDDHDQRESHFPFAPNKQILVFSSSPLINCHY